MYIMAATRVMMTAAQTTSCFLAKRAFLLPAKTSHGALCFNRRALALKSKRPFSCSAIYNPQVKVKEEGQPETLDYRVFFLDGSGKKVSPWHDIPLSLGDGVYNFIVEIPKESKAKMEVATDEASTPIKQDTKKGKLRYYPYNIKTTRSQMGSLLTDSALETNQLTKSCGYCFMFGNETERSYNGSCLDYALKIIHETNESWAKLVKRSVDAGDLSLF
ncbi:LOW QUALITY PROTEIN: hypothetical protein HID58_045141 [Brassica napus]|uniref:inorganic diphosphatase n=1 Tax=Brassica napus TaxID=3708 RepID=A0ABQ8ASX4_BRANA|nr:LOW QUALITY PROTEIN: hypothetical protein HID58_045141 [Brassica napus]